MVVLKVLEKEFNQEEYKLLTQEIPAEENGFINHASGLSKEEYIKWVEEMIQSSKGIDLKDGYVAQTVYIIYKDNTPVGYLKARHELSEKLRKHGGHIGLSICKKYRGLGYGTSAIEQAVEILKNEFRQTEILETIDEENLASRKAAEKNGFILEKIDEGTCYYWKKI